MPFFIQKVAKTTSISDIVTLYEKNLSPSVEIFNIFLQKMPKKGSKITLFSLIHPIKQWF